MILRSELALSIALLCPLAIAQFPPAPGNPGATCHWVYPPALVTELCNTTVFPLGVLTITTTHCSKLWYGLVQWDMKTYHDVCEATLNYRYIFIPAPLPGLPPTIIPVPIGSSYHYERVCDSVVSTSDDVLGVQQCSETHIGFNSPINFQVTQSTLTLASSEDLVHDVVDAASATFDGSPLTMGQVVSMRTQRPGPHSYVVHRSDGMATSTHIVAITVQPSYLLHQVDIAAHATVLPTAAFEFTNNTDDEIDIELVATSLTPSCEAQLFGNQLHVMPHQTFQGEVAFTNVEGHAIPTGAALVARLDVHAVSPQHALLTFAQLSAASCVGSSGSGEDLSLTTLVNGGGLPNLCAKSAACGALYTVAINSPAGGFTGAPTMAFFDIFTLGEDLVPLLPQFPEFHLTANLQMLLPMTTLPAGGLTVTAPLPTAALGHVLRVQAVAMSSSAANGLFATTDAHDVNVY